MSTFIIFYWVHLAVNYMKMYYKNNCFSSSLTIRKKNDGKIIQHFINSTTVFLMNPFIKLCVEKHFPPHFLVN